MIHWKIGGNLKKALCCRCCRGSIHWALLMGLINQAPTMTTQSLGGKGRTVEVHDGFVTLEQWKLLCSSVRVTVTNPLPTGRQAFRMRLISSNGDDACIEIGSSMLEFRQEWTRASSFDSRASIRASTTINVGSLKIFWTCNMIKWRYRNPYQHP